MGYSEGSCAPNQPSNGAGFGRSVHNRLERYEVKIDTVVHPINLALL